MSPGATERLDWKDIKKSADQFALRYKDAKKEESFKQSFWIDFFKIFGVDAIQVGTFEYYVKKLGVEAGQIDYFWPGKVVIEHKSAGKDLNKAYDQAMDYLLGIRDSIEFPKYVIVSDFKRIRLSCIKEGERFDETYQLSELSDNIERFGFLAGYDNKRIEGQHPVNVKAAEVMGRLYDLLKESNYPAEDLNLLLIRLVFCLFAEDADVFNKNIFTDYLNLNTKGDGSGVAGALTEIFSVLNTPYEKRQKAISSSLMDFPYVNGGLFAKNIPAPAFDREMRDCLLEASRLDWKYISPAIFGSLFQCIMDPSMRRELGAHYTSEENILKLIKPLFLDDLRAEYEKFKKNKKELRKLWDKISEIQVMDPACGCGNFLIITYREMRRLEMDILSSLYEGQMLLDESHLHIDHYYGIEIGDFPSMVASLSIILMDHLMNLEMSHRLGLERDIIPLKEKANIVCADSLEIDWSSVVDPNSLTYIIGNPPFVGAKLQTPEQRGQMERFFSKNAGIMDFVSAWYVKAYWFMKINPRIKTGFVSTNSITQGEQVEPLWKPLFDDGININFAYRTFKWSNEAKGVAAVHVVIVGFSLCTTPCRIFVHSDGLTGEVITNNVSFINAYLVDGPSVFLENRPHPICHVPEIGIGNKPIDDGNYLFSLEEMKLFIEKEPKSAEYFRKWMGSREFINGEERYCLWLGDCSSDILKTMPECLKRIDAVRLFRLSSKSKQTRNLADVPTRFHVENMPDSDFLVVPETSSEKRNYIPIGFVQKDVLCSNSVKIMPNANYYYFGILTSKMHMVWTRYVCGRLKSDYRYSVGIVYNNYPWPNPTECQKQAIEDAAKHLLEVRGGYRDISYADLYDPLTMPADLLSAHKRLDKVVEKAYKESSFRDDGERISFLFKLYEKIKSN